MTYPGVWCSGVCESCKWGKTISPRFSYPTWVHYPPPQTFFISCFKSLHHSGVQSNVRDCDWKECRCGGWAGSYQPERWRWRMAFQVSVCMPIFWTSLYGVHRDYCDGQDDMVPFLGWICRRLARSLSWWTMLPMRLISRRSARNTDWNTYSPNSKIQDVLPSLEFFASKGNENETFHKEAKIQLCSSNHT